MMQGGDLSAENLREERSSAELANAAIQAMKSLDPELRYEYDQAAEAAPDLVAQETPFLDFLRTEDMDVMRAAKRFVLYWKYRKKFLGERWLFSMNITGSGCLTAHDIALLQTGALVVLPRSNQGPLVISDRSRFDEAWSVDCTAPLLFYLVSTGLAGELAQTFGFTQLQVVTSARRPDLPIAQDTWKMVLTALPFRLKHILVAQSVEEGRNYLIESLAYQQARTTEFTSGLPVERIVSSTTEGVCQQLVEHGISVEHIPTSLGGQYDYSDFKVWLQQRAAMEAAGALNTSPVTGQRSLFPIVPVAFLPVPDKKSLKRDKAVDCSDSSSTDQTMNDVPFVSDAEFRRHRNAMYQRRFCQRQQLTTGTLKEHVRVLRQRNESIRRDNLILEQLVIEARRLTRRTSDETGHGEDEDVL